MTPNTEQKLTNIHHYGIDPENREVYLHSYLTDGDDEFGVDYRCAVAFEKNIRYLDSISNEPIIIHMHMCGGDWSDCLGIYDTIIHAQSPIGCLAYAKAESASGVIFQAADLRIIMPNAYMLIHYGSLSLDGEHKAALSNLKWNEKEAVKMIDIFAEKSANSIMAKEKEWKKSAVKKHITSQLSNKSDWILTPEESVYYGFADGIFGTSPYSTIEHIKKKLNSKK
jgi:ATP-dependent protease ClpP protease subunit